jgi:hypothetical protein
MFAITDGLKVALQKGILRQRVCFIAQILFPPLIQVRSELGQKTLMQRIIA